MHFDKIVLDAGPFQQRVFRQIGDIDFDVNWRFVADRSELLNHRQRDRIGCQPAQYV